MDVINKPSLAACTTRCFFVEKRHELNQGRKIHSGNSGLGILTGFLLYTYMVTSLEGLSASKIRRYAFRLGAIVINRRNITATTDSSIC